MLQNNIYDLFLEGFENTMVFIFVVFSNLNKKYCLKNIIRTVNVMFQNNILDLFFEGFENTTFLFLLGSRILTKNIV